MTLWIGNGAVLKSSSQWQLKEFWKWNNSGHELFIFKINRIHSSPTAAHCSDDGYVEKQLTAVKEYFAEYWQN